MSQYSKQRGGLCESPAFDTPGLLQEDCWAPGTDVSPLYNHGLKSYQHKGGSRSLGLPSLPGKCGYLRCTRLNLSALLSLNAVFLETCTRFPTDTFEPSTVFPKAENKSFYHAGIKPNFGQKEHVTAAPQERYGNRELELCPVINYSPFTL